MGGGFKAAMGSTTPQGEEGLRKGGGKTPHRDRGGGHLKISTDPKQQAPYHPHQHLSQLTFSEHSWHPRFCAKHWNITAQAPGFGGSPRNDACYVECRPPALGQALPHWNHIMMLFFLHFLFIFPLLPFLSSPFSLPPSLPRSIHLS